jgi:hypothetical protein
MISVRSELDATLDHHDIQISAIAQSFVRVRDSMERGRGIFGGDKALDLPVHANGKTQLNFVREHKGSSLRSHFEWSPSESSTAPFFDDGRGLTNAAEEICSMESSQGDSWSTVQLEICIHRLAECSQAACTHDLVRLIVSL